MGVTVWRHPDSRVYHYRFQVSGKRVQRSTRLRFREPAEALANAAYAEALILSNGGQPIPTLRAMFEEWEVLRAPVASAAHRRSISVVKRLHLYDLGELPLNELTTERIETARNKHLQTHRPATVNHWLRVIKLIVNWAVARKILPALPWKVPMIKLQKRPRPILPLQVAMDWLAQVDAAARRPSVGTAVRLMFGAGLREGEAAGARWEWLDWERRTYTPGETKGREAEPVPLPDWLIDYLAPLRRDEGLIAPRADGGQLGAGFARDAMRAANAKCCIKGITPHRLRGSFATLLSEAGANVQTIQAVMRHKSPLTTMAYLEKDLGTVALAQAKIAEKTGLLRRESGATHQSGLSET
jgi:integrase